MQSIEIDPGRNESMSKIPYHYLEIQFHYPPDNFFPPYSQKVQSISEEYILGTGSEKFPNRFTP